MKGVAALQAEGAGNLVAHSWRGTAGQGDGLRRSQPVPEPGEHTVARPEITPPLGDAMGFVNHEKAGTNALGLEFPAQPLEALRRDVQQPKATVLNLGLNPDLLIFAQRAIETCRRKAPRNRRLYLVLHKGDQRRDNDSEAAEYQGGYLKEDGLATPGGQHGEGVSALQNGADYRRLGRPEIGVAEMVLEKPAGFHHGVEHG